MTTYLVDNSIWLSAGTSSAIARRLREISVRHLIITCPPQVLEYCHSARSPQEYLELRADMEGLCSAGTHPVEKDALDIQQALTCGDRLSEAAAFDCLIAAYAVVNDAVILNSDREFGAIERATAGAARQEYIAA